jgi:uncharacterized protein with FMN-binding domain
MPTVRCLAVVAILIALSASAARADDLLELSSGAKVRGKVTAKTDKAITIEVVIGSRTLSRVYPLDRVAAVTINGKRESIAGAASAAPATRTPAANATASTGRAAAPAPLAPGGTRSKAEVEALINQMGKSPPEWFDSTPLNYPKSLDLSFPQPAPGGWNNQKNVGQYIWDIINPNENKWREGVRLMHHLLAVNKDSRDVQQRTMLALGNMYHNLLEDYARAAFWWRAAGVEKSGNPPGAAAHLAECYWRLGSKQMAVEMIRSKPQTSPMIKLWADMGETNQALQLAERLVRGGYPSMAYLYAGDACRVGGQNAKAIDYYQKVLAVKAEGNQKARIEREQDRARASLEAIRLFALSDVRKVPDGAYRDSSLGYEGQIEVEVVVRDKRIEDVRVTKHKEKQFYSALTDTPRKIIARQGVKGVDATSSATITSEAIINATAKALAGAAK